MIYKVVVSPSIVENEEALQQLRLLGCEERPYFTTASRVCFRADVEIERSSEIRNLSFVIDMEVMPSYGFGK